MEESKESKVAAHSSSRHHRTSHLGPRLGPLPAPGAPSHRLGDSSSYLYPPGGPPGAAIPKAPEPKQHRARVTRWRGVAGRRKVSVAPARRSGSNKQPTGQKRAPTGSVPLSAPRRSGSRAPWPLGLPGPANRLPRHAQLRPPGLDRAEAGRRGAGAHLFGQWTPLLPPSPGGLGRADLLSSRHTPPVPTLAPDPGQVTRPLPSHITPCPPIWAGPHPRSASPGSASLPRPSEWSDFALFRGPRIAKIKSQL